MIFSKNTEIGICILFCAISAFAQPDTKFDKLRGFAYNPYGTLGAAPTIGDLVTKPNMIYGSKFVYILPTDHLGYAGFDMLGGSMLLGFDNAELYTGNIIIGYARKSWGLSLDLSIHKSFTGYEKYNYEESSNFRRNNIGLNLSVPLGNYVFYTKAGLTTEDNYMTSIFPQEERQTKSASIGITGGEKFIWDLSFDFARNENDQDRTYIEERISDDQIFVIGEIDNSSSLTLTSLNYKIGYKVLQNNRARLIVGLDNRFDWFYTNSKAEYFYYYPDYDEYERENSSYNLSLRISPNVFGEVALTDNLFAFVGAGHSFYIDDKDGRLLQIENSSSNSYIGLRYGRELWAIEAMLANDIYESIKNKVNPLINLGGFIYF